jgi:hypothetical protein
MQDLLHENSGFSLLRFPVFSFELVLRPLGSLALPVLFFPFVTSFLLRLCHNDDEFDGDAEMARYIDFHTNEQKSWCCRFLPSSPVDILIETICIFKQVLYSFPQQAQG